MTVITSRNNYLSLQVFLHRLDKSITVALVNLGPVALRIESFSIIICDRTMGMEESKFLSLYAKKRQFASGALSSLKQRKGTSLNPQEKINLYSITGLTSDSICGFFYKYFPESLDDIILTVQYHDEIGELQTKTFENLCDYTIKFT